MVANLKHHGRAVDAVQWVQYLVSMHETLSPIASTPGNLLATVLWKRSVPSLKPAGAVGPGDWVRIGTYCFAKSSHSDNTYTQCV